jgi:GT2 family glycosyltransferase
MKTLSIIIVTYKSQEDILNCLSSIFETSDIPREAIDIIVIDNSSKEVFIETEELIISQYGTEINIIHNYKNGGYGQGNNFGIQNAKAEVICIVNPDVIFLKPIFQEALNMFNVNERLAMIGGKQFGGGDISYWIRPEYDFFLFTAPISKILNKFNIYLQKYFYLSGALLFVSKTKFLEIGGFDEKMFMYCEEADITKRFLQKNYETSYRKDFHYQHLIDERSEAGEMSLKFLINSYKIYFSKFDFNYRGFMRRRIFTFKALMLFGKLFGNKQLHNKNLKYFEIFRKLQ